jgi:phospholipid/cholesterol/gamma-HCH transport system substrate-binding protein
VQDKRITFSVGLLIILSAVLIITSIAYVIGKKGLFKEPIYLHLVSDSGDSLSKGLPIKFSGFKIGQVFDMVLADNGKVNVKISLPQNQKKWLRQKSSFYLVKPLIGSSYISIRDIDINQDSLDLSLTYPIMVENNIDDLIKKVQPILENVEDITKDVKGSLRSTNLILLKLADENGSLFKTLENLEYLSRKLAYSKSLLNTVTGNKNSNKEMQYILQNTNGLLKETKATLTNLKMTIYHLDQKIFSDENSTIEQVNAIALDFKLKLQRLDSTVDYINSSLGDISNTTKDLPAIKEEIHFMIQKSDKLINKLDTLLVDEQKDLKLP